MVKKGAAVEDESGEFLKTLKNGVKDVLADDKAEASERVAAINAGAKLLMIEHKITGGDEKGFFDA
jgi:hypothetical protein